MRLEITQAARKEIFAIQDSGMKQFGAIHTDLFLDGLTALFKLLALSPYIARERTEFKQPIRLHPYKSFMIAYIVENETVKIIRVVYGRQDLTKIF
jgi:toxin ParE1/3/4